MKVSGSYQFNASAINVWAVLTDPKALAHCIPNCEGLNPIGNDEYQAVMTVGIGPIKGRYKAKISMRDQVPHQSYRLAIEGTGGGGFINGDAIVSLIEDNGKTTVRVDGESQAGGPVARVGQRMMDNAAQIMMNKFFACLEQSVR